MLGDSPNGVSGQMAEIKPWQDGVEASSFSKAAQGNLSIQLGSRTLIDESCKNLGRASMECGLGR